MWSWKTETVQFVRALTTVATLQKLSVVKQVIASRLLWRELLGRRNGAGGCVGVFSSTLLFLCMVYSIPQSCTSSNSECSGFPSTPVCDTVSQTCKACSSGADCLEGKHCSYSGANSGACVECTDNYHCKVDTPICSIGNTCTACSSGGDCPSGTLGDGEIAAVVICSLIGAGAIIAFFVRGGFSSMSFGGLRGCASLAPVGLRGDARLAPVKVVPTNGISSLNMPVPAYIVRAKLDTRHSSSNIVSV